jgi:hypothetical protein
VFVVSHGQGWGIDELEPTTTAMISFTDAQLEILLAHARDVPTAARGGFLRRVADQLRRGAVTNYAVALACDAAASERERPQ